MESTDLFQNVEVFTGEMPDLPAVQESPAVLAEVAAQREIAEVQAAMAIAKRFPRNQKKALDRIIIACQRPTLAETALYSYSRGGTDITGPSIRLAEAIGQQWGNLQFGIRELEQRLGESTVEAYAWDLETNTRQSKIFQVRHFRYRKNDKGYALNDPRDIYELVANQGARRLRACILGIIPGDVVDAARDECEKTLRAKADVSPEAVQKMLGVFADYGVSKAMIEARIQRNLESITAAQIIALRKIYNSLKDGMSKPEDWFDLAAGETTTPEPTTPEKKRGRPPKSPQTNEPPEPDPKVKGEESGPPGGDSGVPTGKITQEQRRILEAADRDTPGKLISAWQDAGIDPTKTIPDLSYEEADAIVGSMQSAK